MSKVEIKTVDVYLALPGDWDKFCSCVSATPQEAFAMMTMPALAGYIVKLVPNYELPEMPKE